MRIPPSIRFSLIPLLLALPLPSLAATTPSWELLAGSHIDFGAETNGGTFGRADKSDTFFSVSGVSGYFLTPAWELILSLTVTASTSSTVTTVITPRMGAFYNLSEDTANSFFVG